MNIRRLLLTVAILTLLGAASAVPGQTATLYDPSFETTTNPLPGITAVLGGSSVPFTSGIWGADVASVTTQVGEIQPCGGSRMLSATSGGGVLNDIVQAVDVSADSQCFASNEATATFRAALNAYLPEGSTEPVTVAVGLQFFESALWSGAHSPEYWTTVALDDLESTWEEVSVTQPVPSATKWMVVRIAFHSATLTDGRTGFVDCTELHLDCPTTGCPIVGPCGKSADLNGDGCVNLADIALFAADYYGIQPNPRSDLNCDGAINLLDIVLFVSCMGWCG